MLCHGSNAATSMARVGSRVVRALGHTSDKAMTIAHEGVTDIECLGQTPGAVMTMAHSRTRANRAYVTAVITASNICGRQRVYVCMTAIQI